VVRTPYQFETIRSIPRVMCLIYNRLYNKIQVTRTHPGASPPPQKTTFCRTSHLSEQTISQGWSVTPETTSCRMCHLSEQTLSQGRSPPPAQRLLRFPVAPRVRSAQLAASPHPRVTRHEPHGSGLGLPPARRPGRALLPVEPIGSAVDPAAPSSEPTGVEFHTKKVVFRGVGRGAT